MATKTVTDQNFANDVLGASGPVLVDFWAEWCGPCRMIAPALEEISNDLGDKVTVALTPWGRTLSFAYASRRSAAAWRVYHVETSQGGVALGADLCHVNLRTPYACEYGLVAALQVLAVVKRQGKPVSQVCRRFTPVPQILKNVAIKAGQPLAENRVAKVIEAGRQRLGKTGRLIIRPSGTEPVVRVMGEGDDHDLVEAIVDEICAALSASAAIAAE